MVVERDPKFWTQVAEHPAVAPHVLFGQSGLLVSEVVQHPSVLPFRAEHGGYLFARLDGLGKVYELHSLFTPEGWGREAYDTAVFAFATVFVTAHLVVTYETEANAKSRPPKTFGFAPAGDFSEHPELGRVRTWVLTKEAWTSSPAWRRQCQ